MKTELTLEQELLYLSRHIRAFVECLDSSIRKPALPYFMNIFAYNSDLKINEKQRDTIAYVSKRYLEVKRQKSVEDALKFVLDTLYAIYIPIVTKFESADNDTITILLPIWEGIRSVMKMLTNDICNAYLRSKIKYVELNNSKNKQIYDILKRLSYYGDVYLYGGYLRDILLTNSTENYHDVDVVIACHDTTSYRLFHNQFSRYPGVRKMPVYTGYKIDELTMDIFAIEDAEMVRYPNKKGVSIQKLIDATALSSSMIVYNIEENKAYCSDTYYVDLMSRVCYVNNDYTKSSKPFLTENPYNFTFVRNAKEP